MTGSDGTAVAELGALTWRFQRTLRHLVAQAVSEHDLGLADLGALHTVQVLPGLTSADLARRLDVTPQASNQLIRRLAGRGLLDREPHPTVTRGIALRLTADGERLADLAREAASAAYADLLAPLDPTESSTLLDALRRCSDANPCHPDRATAQPTDSQELR